MSTKITRNGKLKEVQENGKTVLNIKELRNELQEANGNPQKTSIIGNIIDYLEREG